MTESPLPLPAQNDSVQNKTSPEAAGKSVSRLRAADAIQAATAQFGMVTGLTPHAVTGIRGRGQGGWSVLIDVVELARIPDSTSVMATYRVDIEADGELGACERLRRFTRGTTDS
ncbi:Gas vesicle synthesis protein GvpO [Amycolatopsis tolypomycina]|uniref:Gas vesicle synthesis protein GvpO n=1 Tax=Amycolatopsis tolypomycina TaxID=208445 RepID=A0A1H5D664_9PSEU|nr:Gas vesicle synthesis protein GvpO [Amycolatopsis tolypomycina]